MVKVIEVTGLLVIDYRAREWCKLPYPNHPNGCPNYGKNPECPPKAPRIEDWFDLNKRHWFIISEFDLDDFARRMKEKHPSWTDKQCRCCLYWQNTPRKELRYMIEDFKLTRPDTISTLLPEAMGVHVMATARKLKIPIKAKPEGMIYKIALIGYPKHTSGQMRLIDFNNSEV